MKKKTYYIEISGESEGSCIRDLTRDEVKLISGIFAECNSDYVGGILEEVPSKVEFLNYLKNEKLDSYDFEDFRKICEHFKISNSALEMIRFEYLYNN